MGVSGNNTISPGKHFLPNGKSWRWGSHPWSGLRPGVELRSQRAEVLHLQPGLLRGHGGVRQRGLPLRVVPLPLRRGDCTAKGQVVLPAMSQFSSAATWQEELAARSTNFNSNIQVHDFNSADCQTKHRLEDLALCIDIDYCCKGASWKFGNQSRIFVHVNYCTHVCRWASYMFVYCLIL